MRKEKDRGAVRLSRARTTPDALRATVRKGFSWLLLLALTLSAAGCGTGKQEDTPQAIPPVMTEATPEPAITAEPAPLFGSVETGNKVISLIFEGFADAETMDAVVDVLVQKNVPAVFFVSGIAANENPETMEKLIRNGFSVGSYGLSGGKHLEELSAYENTRRFEAAQREIRAACGTAPAFIRCNGTVYTEDVLRAVAAAGLKAAIEPSAYLNHRSFASAEDAGLYAQEVIRGSILSVKIGQELDEAEYGDAKSKSEVRPAIDPPPGIRWEWTGQDPRYAPLQNVVSWLVDALAAKGYVFTDPEQLQQEAQTLLPKLRTLTEEELLELDPERYAFPVSEKPLRAGESRKALPGDLSGAVFVGDRMLQTVGEYVDWRRETEPDYLDGARFLTEEGLTVEALLDEESGIGNLGARLSEMAASSVWLCLGFSSKNACRSQASLLEYRLLIRQISKQNPEIRIVVMSVFPKLDRFSGTSNSDRFALNLMLCGMCREYGFAFTDCAAAVRDELGELREDFCLEPVTKDTRLNDAGCEAVVDFIMENYPR